MLQKTSKMKFLCTNLTASTFLFVLISCVLEIDSYYSRPELFLRPVEHFKKVSAEGKRIFNATEKKLILDLHNAYRSIVVPSATDMPELIWDKDLEAYALNHTKTCTGAHSQRKMIKKWGSNPQSWQTWRNMAENLYYSYAPKYSIKEAIYMFWEEGSGYDIERHTCTHESTCGHYRGLVESHSSRVGCAINICEKFSESKYKTPAVFFQCIYDGAYLTARRPYTVGVVCSDCTREKLGYQFQYCRNRLCISPSLKSSNSGFDGDTSIIGLDYRSVPFTTTPYPHRRGSPSLKSSNSGFDGNTSIIGLDYRSVPLTTTPHTPTKTQQSNRTFKRVSAEAPQGATTRRMTIAAKEIHPKKQVTTKDMTSSAVGGAKARTLGYTDSPMNTSSEVSLKEENTTALSDEGIGNRASTMSSSLMMCFLLFCCRMSLRAAAA